MKITIFPGKYRQNGGFSMAMLVYWRVRAVTLHNWVGFHPAFVYQNKQPALDFIMDFVE